MVDNDVAASFFKRCIDTSEAESMMGNMGKSINKMDRSLLAILALGLSIRLVLAPFLTFNIDVGYWSEVIDVFENGFGLYGTAGYYYTPIWGYFLGFISLMMKIFCITDYGIYVPELTHIVNEDFKVNAFVTSIQFNTLVKIPLILVDVAVTVLLYRITMRFTGDRIKSSTAAGLWFLSPLVITQSSVHGMFDNVSALFILATIMLAIDRRYFIAGSAFSLAVLTKFFPIFLLFFLVAFVLRREGVDGKGAKCVMTAIIGSVSTAIVVYIPNIIRGDFWQSFFFLAYRLGITRETLSDMGTLKTAAILAIITLIVSIITFIIWKYGPRFMEHMFSIDEKKRNRNMAKILIVVALIIVFAIIVLTLINVVTGNEGMMKIESIGLRIVLAISVLSLFLEIYIAFRVLMIKEFDNQKIITTLFLSALAVILWPCAPSYTLVIIPFFIIYAVVVDNEYIRPYVLFSIAMTLMEITAFMTSLTSLSVHTGLIDFGIIVEVIEFLAFPWILGISGAVVLTGIFGTVAYISLINPSIKWYSEYFRGERK